MNTQNAFQHLNSLLSGSMQWLPANHSGGPQLRDSLVFAQLLSGPAANSSTKINRWQADLAQGKAWHGSMSSKCAREGRRERATAPFRAGSHWMSPITSIPSIFANFPISIALSFPLGVGRMLAGQGCAVSAGSFIKSLLLCLTVELTRTGCSISSPPKMHNSQQGHKAWPAWIFFPFPFFLFGFAEWKWLQCKPPQHL